MNYEEFGRWVTVTIIAIIAIPITLLFFAFITVSWEFLGDLWQIGTHFDLSRLSYECELTDGYKCTDGGTLIALGSMIIGWFAVTVSGIIIIMGREK